jgi:hypothetical protein
MRQGDALAGPFTLGVMTELLDEGDYVLGLRRIEF